MYPRPSLSTCRLCSLASLCLHSAPATLPHTHYFAAGMRISHRRCTPHVHIRAVLSEPWCATSRRLPRPDGRGPLCRQWLLTTQPLQHTPVPPPLHRHHQPCCRVPRLLQPRRLPSRLSLQRLDCENECVHRHRCRTCVLVRHVAPRRAQKRGGGQPKAVNFALCLQTARGAGR